MNPSMTPMGGGISAGGALPILQSPESQPVLENSSSDQSCATCRFFSPAESRCLKNPPVGSQWSMVTPADWCSFFEPGEQRGMNTPEGGEFSEQTQLPPEGF